MPTSSKSYLRPDLRIHSLHEYWIYSKFTLYKLILFRFEAQDTTGFATARARRYDIPLLLFMKRQNVYALYFLKQEIPKDFASYPVGRLVLITAKHACYKRTTIQQIDAHHTSRSLGTRDLEFCLALARLCERAGIWTFFSDTQEHGVFDYFEPDVGWTCDDYGWNNSILEPCILVLMN